MLNKNCGSTILLIFLVGFVIYKLMQPNAIKNQGSVANNEQNSGESHVVGNDSSMNAEPALLSAETNSVHSFLGNMEEDDGAKLEDAYNKPIPESSSSNTVDFNKNVVEKYDVEDYLPQEVNQEWFDYDNNSVNAGTDKMINTERYVIGVNTVGQSLRNASYDLRTAPPNPKFTTGPWNNSTIEADHNIKPLC